MEASQAQAQQQGASSQGAPSTGAAQPDQSDSLTRGKCPRCGNGLLYVVAQTPEAELVKCLSCGLSDSRFTSGQPVGRPQEETLAAQQAQPQAFTGAPEVAAQGGQSAAVNAEQAAATQPQPAARPGQPGGGGL